MASIPQTKSKQQEGDQHAPTTLEEQTGYRLVVRFGKDMLSDGFTAIPNFLLDLYAELGITHCELVFILHLLQYKWSKAEPYPSLGTLATKMGLSLRAVQNHVHALRNKAYHCSHTDEENCTCPKYLVVTPRYRVGIGQTSNSYNLSGLFAAVLTLAREKDLLPQEEQEKSCTGSHETSCMGGMKQPAHESDESNNTQSEPNEPFSKLRGRDEVITPACSHIAHSAIRNQNQEIEPSAPVSNAHTVPTPQRNPSSPNRPDRSNLESPPSGEQGRAPRKSFFRKDEVKREATRELPRIKPFTQDEIEVLRQQGKNASGQTPLQAILDGISPPEHRQTLSRQFGGDLPTELRTRPKPVYPRLQIAVEKISEKLGDFHHAPSNITHVDNIRREAGVPIEQLLDVLDEAYYATHTANQKGRITKRDEAGRQVKMSYFFAVLRQKLNLPPKPPALV